MAPEITTSTKGYRGPPADLFAVGVLLFVMVTARFPFSQADPQKDRLFYAIQFGDTKFFWAYHDQMSGSNDLSAEMKDLITCMLQAKPLHRPAICEVLAHPWFAGETPLHADIVKEFQARD
jgi:serine/threonine protein kinase